MKHKNQNLPLPLKAIKNFEKHCPHCWEYVEFMRNGQGNDYPLWNSLCYIPIAATNAILQNKCNIFNMETCAYYAALSAWRQFKEIYTFSTELKETLYSQANTEITIPIEILYHIPYPCVYISFDQNNGFFSFFEHDTNTNELELRFLFVQANGDNIEPTLNVYLHLKEGYTVSDGIKRGIEIIRENAKNNGFKLSENELSNFEKYVKTIISRNIQLILYICADNAEIESSSTQGETKKADTNTLRNVPPKDVFREIRSWDVGFKYAKLVKEYNQNNTSNETSDNADSYHNSFSKKRPHTRRGHWHHYWTGSTSNNSRKLILKWTAPIFVAGNSDETITTINNVE